MFVYQFGNKLNRLGKLPKYARYEEITNSILYKSNNLKGMYP